MPDSVSAAGAAEDRAMISQDLLNAFVHNRPARACMLACGASIHPRLWPAILETVPSIISEMRVSSMQQALTGYPVSGFHMKIRMRECVVLPERLGGGGLLNGLGRANRKELYDLGSSGK